MGLNVYKFGGASIGKVSSLQQVLNIIKNDAPGLVVVSALGKTTNRLEEVLSQMLEGKKTEALALLDAVLDNHFSVFSGAGISKENLRTTLSAIRSDFLARSKELGGLLYDEAYDSIVSLGELLSTKLMRLALTNAGVDSEWWDARRLIYTNSQFREGEVDWVNTELAILNQWKSDQTKVVITQGFIGADPFGKTTTLGREGSDFSGAIFASVLRADSFTIWKDVPGLMTGDPKVFKDVEKLVELDYSEAMELAYYGASVIHPKTIAPLKKRNIPLWVKSFINPAGIGTLIHALQHKPKLPQSIILKANQVLVTLSTLDYTILSDDKMAKVLSTLQAAGLKSNLIEINALNISVCLDFDQFRLSQFLSALQGDFAVKYNLNLGLLTIRHGDTDAVPNLVAKSRVLVEQRNRVMRRWVFPYGDNQE
ncbi:MAG: aspartate kinase [Sphingobacteriales bacterium]|jgi:aspartate kinase